MAHFIDAHKILHWNKVTYDRKY